MRRPILRTLALAIGPILVAGGAAGAQPTPSGQAPPAATGGAPGFVGSADLPGAVQISSEFSQDKQAASVIFRNLQVEVGGKTGANVGARTQTVSLSLANNTSKPLHVTQDVHGFVSVQGGARPVLIVQSGGVTNIVDTSKARTDSNAPTPAPSPSLAQAKKAAVAKAKAPAAPKRPANSAVDTYDYAKRIEADIPANAGYQITLILLVERDAASDSTSGVLAVDSLDVEIVTPPTGQ